MGVPSRRGGETPPASPASQPSWSEKLEAWGSRGARWGPRWGPRHAGRWPLAGFCPNCCQAPSKFILVSVQGGRLGVRLPPLPHPHLLLPNRHRKWPHQALERQRMERPQLGAREGQGGGGAISSWGQFPSTRARVTASEACWGDVQVPTATGAKVRAQRGPCRGGW